MPMSSAAVDRPRPVELWRAYPLGPNAGDASTAVGPVSGPAGQAPVDRSGSPGEGRLVLQLAMLSALCIAFLGGWFVAIHRAPALRMGGGRVGRARSRALASVREMGAPFRARPAAHPWTCEIAWQHGEPRSRFHAVMVSPDGRSRRVVAESMDVPWPPPDGHTPPTRELEAALGSLVASLVAAGWEPISSGGSWSQRRFVWRHEGEPPTTIWPSGTTAARPRSATTARRRAGQRQRSEDHATRRR
jgi:hypothetical protein